ncbi:hypothetical protein KCP75_17850 [Salmonella enterica subsp. enterica]|nr:hypothetical protein KCP75_17850 [Salmonella enterica subsp. enterica]
MSSSTSACRPDKAQSAAIQQYTFKRKCNECILANRKTLRAIAGDFIAHWSRAHRHCSAAG